MEKRERRKHERGDIRGDKKREKATTHAVRERYAERSEGNERERRER